MDKPKIVINLPELTPLQKYQLHVSVLNALGYSKLGQVEEAKWFISAVITKCRTKYDVYHYMPKQLHKYVMDFILNPQENTPIDAKKLVEQYPEAIEAINIRLTEMMLEE